MKKSVKIFVAAWAVLTLLFLSGCTEETYPKPTGEFFVNDFAEVMTEADKKEILNQGAALDKACKGQVVVVTVKSLGNKDLEQYSIGLAREWGIGGSEKNNGVLILLATDERQVRIEVGSGLEGALNDAKTGRILDYYGVPYFKKDDFSTGLKQVYVAVTAEVYKEYGLENNAQYLVENQPYAEQNKGREISLVQIIAVVVLFIIFLIVGRILRRKGIIIFGGFGGPRGPGGFGGFGGGGGFSGGGFSGGGGGFSGGGSSRGF